MSYNGIGLSTPRGSGTNGYVMANKSYIRPRQPWQRDLPPPQRSLASMEPNQDLLLHEKKRQVELKCLQLRQILERKGSLSADEIDAQCSQLKAELLEALSGSYLERGAKTFDTHHLADLKRKESEKFARALGIRDQEYQEGSAFDPDYQEQQKQLRLQAREEKRQRWEQEQSRREQERLRQDSAKRSPKITTIQPRSRRGRSPERRSLYSSKHASRDERRRRSPSFSISSGSSGSSVSPQRGGPVRGKRQASPEPNYERGSGKRTRDRSSSRGRYRVKDRSLSRGGSPVKSRDYGRRRSHHAKNQSISPDQRPVKVSRDRRYIEDRSVSRGRYRTKDRSVSSGKDSSVSRDRRLAKYRSKSRQRRHGKARSVSPDRYRTQYRKTSPHRSVSRNRRHVKERSSSANRHPTRHRNASPDRNLSRGPRARKERTVSPDYPASPRIRSVSRSDIEVGDDYVHRDRSMPRGRDTHSTVTALKGSGVSSHGAAELRSRNEPDLVITRNAIRDRGRTRRSASSDRNSTKEFEYRNGDELPSHDTSQIVSDSDEPRGRSPVQRDRNLPSRSRSPSLSRRPSHAHRSRSPFHYRR